ncbi:unnamed protein product [Miscanthus lutarioriparius]|uniref:HAT C-terminal dimerisation domain-containing protein n=1 Tax=Miscanthus lutarioriparius TaxID=422564 RepID=A0A811R7M2_9POAL|nr:unnamed protein product [Miscanthus lutarioriparius]
MFKGESRVLTVSIAWRLSADKGRSHLNRHTQTCPARIGNNINHQKAQRERHVLALPAMDDMNPSEQNTSSTQTATDITRKPDQEASYQELTRMIISHGYPLSIVEHEEMRRKEKADLKERIALLSHRVSLSASVWAPHGAEALVKYLCLAVHFIDSDWKLQGKPSNLKITKLLSLFAGYSGLFYRAVEVICGPVCPTANMYFNELWKVRTALQEEASTDHTELANMVWEMQEAFNEHWQNSYVWLSIPVVLDPRFKITFIEFVGWIDSDSLEDWDEHLNAQTRNQQLTELDNYLEDCLVPRKDDFDILNWWMSNSTKYPTLSVMARDVLAVPASAVNFEPALSGEIRRSQAVHNHSASNLGIQDDIIEYTAHFIVLYIRHLRSHWYLGQIICTEPLTCCCLIENSCMTAIESHLMTDVLFMLS